MYKVATTLLLAAVLASPAFAEDPAAPTKRVTDRAGILKEAELNQLETTLREMEEHELARMTVYIDTAAPASEQLDAYTTRLVNAWGIGDEKREDGVTLFVFVNDRRMRMEIGPGLDYALPAEVAQGIIDNDLKPAFRQGNQAYALMRAISTIARTIDTARSKAERESAQP